MAHIIRDAPFDAEILGVRSEFNGLGGDKARKARKARKGRAEGSRQRADKTRHSTVAKTPSCEVGALLAVGY